MMIKRGQIVFAFVASILFALSFGYLLSDGIQGSSSDSSVLHYKGYVCVYKNGEVVSCDHNLLYDNGKNLTRNALGTGVVGAILNISLCNATAGCAGPVAAASETFNTYVNCGLNSNAGTYAVLNNAPGNWSVSKTFTSTCDSIEVNSTRLSNQTGSVFAGNTFTLVTLQTNDQLTINWTLMIS